ncbi:ApaG protein [Nonlabens ulvanivorans]|nr:ApaG protein [Nonlabens ulvanivorans]
MIQQVTRGIKISVQTSFEGTFYKNYKMHFAFGYVITIENQSKNSVQLTSRHWKIKDSSVKQNMLMVKAS